MFINNYLYYPENLSHLDRLLEPIFNSWWIPKYFIIKEMNLRSICGWTNMTGALVGSLMKHVMHGLEDKCPSLYEISTIKS